MKRASYRYGVQWIAANDDPEETDPETIAGYISALLLADLFDKEPATVARDIAKARTTTRHNETK